MMTSEEISMTAANATFPLEVHVFEHDGAYYCFDARNYAILKLNAAGAAVLSLMATHTFQEILEELAGQVQAGTVRTLYVRFLEMIRDGIFSIEAVPRPSRPPFSHLVIMLAGGC